MTANFVRTFFGRVFDHPDRVFDESFLRPETQDLEAFVDGVHNITEAQQRVALAVLRGWFHRGRLSAASGVLSIMAHGNFEGTDAHDPTIRQLFTPEALLASDWYRRRLVAKQARGHDVVAAARQHAERLARRKCHGGKLPRRPDARAPRPGRAS